ncbi:hypothetical protein SmJEL517_g01307 [Synchytrium microbalum]|uniref:Core Histone H2A/H2B/H3 domain-containing protein n=1 Tax=Synchytrium microbalum TaxID=1806994 RepID=A0A507CEU7_9FUNG|nr:uncharacterized protein SmJEL517_g01307 [Synchytrium microbalum]TPX36546.1 hypothetical protein SmJEL517_g01307 [Synchytrium microbalum]
MDSPPRIMDEATAAAIMLRQQAAQAGGAALPADYQQIVQSSQMLQAFWNQQLAVMENGEPEFKQHALPIARIKKVMKSDDDVKSLMISAEAPILFARACEIFIEELTLRAWMHAEENKRRTLQKSDIQTAVSKSDMYDFLIDIVPRDVEVVKSTTTINIPKDQQQEQQQQYIQYAIPSGMTPLTPEQFAQYAPQRQQQRPVSQEAILQQLVAQEHAKRSASPDRNPP